MNVVALIISMIFFIGGLLLMGYAPEMTSFQAPVFFAGILCVALSFGLPMTFLRKLD